jgi:predicted dehydrogenase
MIASGEVGALLNVNAMVWQDWALQTSGTWRQDPASSGGGFLFDTGAHMLNTVTDIAGQEIDQVAAWLENDDRAVDIRGVIIARLGSGALVTMNGCGRAIPGYASDVRVFCERATLRTGIWGERLEMQKFGSRRLSPVRSVPTRTVWEQFLAVRSGSEPNPSPPEVGLKMARLWDAVRESSTRGGAVVHLGATR